MDAIKKRIAYQNDPTNIPFENSGFSFLPKMTDVCKQISTDNSDVKCNFDLFDNSQTEVQKVLNKSYQISEQKDLIRDYNPFPESQILFDKLYNPRLIDTNPLIPVTLIFMNSIQTATQREFNVDLNENYKNNVFPKESKIQINKNWKFQNNSWQRLKTKQPRR